MSVARAGLEGQVVAIMRAIRERGRVEAEALARRLEQERDSMKGGDSKPAGTRGRKGNPSRLAAPPTG